MSAAVTSDETLVIETPERVPLHFALASIGNRFLACALDHFIQMLAMLVVVLLFAWLGNTAQRAIQESYGIMVNYLYDHDSIEANHEAFVRDGTIVRSPDVDTLLHSTD